MVIRASKIGIACLAGIILASCNSTRSLVQVRVENPPELAVKESGGHFVVLNRLDPKTLSFDNDNKTEIYRFAIDSYLQGLMDGIESNGNYSVTLVRGPVFVSEDTRKDAMPLDPAKVVLVLEEYGANYVIALDKMDLYFTRDTEKDEDDNKTMHSTLHVRVTTTFYDTLGYIRRRAWDHNSIHHESRSVESGLLAVGPSLGRADENARKISYRCGLKFADKFYPTWSQESRWFYTNEEFGQVEAAFDRDNLDELERLLEPWINGENKELAGRAAYNLGVMYEARGDSAAANTWYEKAKELMGSTYPGK